MAQFTRKGIRGFVLLMVILSLTLAACGSSAATKKPTETKSSAPSAVASEKASQGAEETEEASEQPSSGEATEEPSSGGEGIGDAVNKLSDIKSYKFTMTMKGGSYGSMLGDAPIKGTIVTEPEKAAYLSVMGMEIVEVGGKSYVKMGTGWIQSDSSTSSMADDFAPSKMLGGFVGGSAAEGYKKAGEEKKNGVDTVHYVADANVLNQYGSSLGVKDAKKWTADMWVAKQGGYPVSVVITATGGEEDFLFGMDITNVNDPGNKVEKPNI